LESDEMVQLDEVLTELRKDARTLAKDLVSGIEMVRAVELLCVLIAFVFAYFALVYLFVLPLLQGGNCCYVLTWPDLIGGLTSIAAIPIIIWKAAKIRRKHLLLRSRYSKLLELDTALGK
jgi:hypothetical protein